MQKPLESSQQMSYKAMGSSTVLRPGQASAGLWSAHLPEACKNRTLDQHTETPRALENREQGFLNLAQRIWVLCFLSAAVWAALTRDWAPCKSTQEGRVCATVMLGQGT